jgi:hypothetical protein
MTRHWTAGRLPDAVFALTDRLGSRVDPVEAVLRRGVDLHADGLLVAKQIDEEAEVGAPDGDDL